MVDTRTLPQTRVARFRAGVPIALIARRDGVTFHTVYDYLRKQGALPDSYLEDEFVAALVREGVPAPERQYAFVQAAPPELQQHFLSPKRKQVRGWKTDFAWPWHKLAVEIDGGQFVPGGGRHNQDREKRNAYAICGWRVLYFDAKMLEEPDACVQFVALALACLASK